MVAVQCKQGSGKGCRYSDEHEVFGKKIKSLFYESVLSFFPRGLRIKVFSPVYNKGQQKKYSQNYIRQNQ